MITAVELRVGHTIVQPMGAGRGLRLVFRWVRDLDRAWVRGAGYVRTRVVEDGGGQPFDLWYPPAHQVRVLPPGTRTVERFGPHAWAVTDAGLVCLRPGCPHRNAGDYRAMVTHVRSHQ